MNEDQFGYGLSFGGSFPWNMGLDVQLLGFYENRRVFKRIWIQTNVDGFYDFNHLWKKVTEKIELHPYAKLGFTYGLNVVYGSAFNSELGRGPGLNVGGGVDYKILPYLTVGLDFSETIAFVDAVTIEGTQLGRKSTQKLFNLLAVVKLFAY